MVVNGQQKNYCADSPCEHYGSLYCGYLDGFISLLHPKSPNPGLKLFLCVLILLDKTVCCLCRHLR